jgi:hypothetical protein
MPPGAVLSKLTEPVFEEGLALDGAAPLSTAVPALPARNDPLCKSAIGIIG